MLQKLTKALIGKIEKKSAGQVVIAKQKMRDEASIWFERGLLEENKNGSSKDALELYRKAVQCDVSHYPAVFNLAQCYEKMGKPSITKKWLLRLIEVTPTFLPAYTSLTRILM